MSFASSSNYDRVVRQINGASKKRQELLDAGRLSLPRGAGKLAILVAQDPTISHTTSGFKLRQAFLAEAERLREERLGDNQDVVVRRHVTPSLIKHELIDPEVTDMVLIGHGSIGSFQCDGSGNNFDWYGVSRAVTHLKQGNFEQRMCGSFPVGKYAVPMGTFAVADLTNVVAAAGRKVDDINPDEALFQPVFTEPDGPIQQIRQLNIMYFRQDPNFAVA